MRQKIRQEEIAQMQGGNIANCRKTQNVLRQSLNSNVSNIAGAPCASLSEQENNLSQEQQGSSTPEINSL